MTTTIETDGPIRPGSIVAAVDGSPHADQALTWAAEEARLTAHPLAIVHVERVLGSAERGWLARAGIPLSQITQEIHHDSTELLHRARTEASMAAPAVEAELVLRLGDAREKLMELAQQASMIVLGSRGRGPVSSLVLGSVSIAVSRHATCPVVVVRPRQDIARLRGILVGTDGTARSTSTLEAGFREASLHGLPLTVVHCRWESLSAPGGWRAVPPSDCFHAGALVRVAEVLDGLRDKFPEVQVDVETFAGHVDQCLADLSREHELTVIGRHERTLLERVGSFSMTTAVLEHACGPVLVVP